MSKHKKRKLYTRKEDEDDELNGEADKINEITKVLSTSCNSILIQVSKDYDKTQIYEMAINKYFKLSEEDENLKKLKILYSEYLSKVFKHSLLISYFLSWSIKVSCHREKSRMAEKIQFLIETFIS